MTLSTNRLRKERGRRDGSSQRILKSQIYAMLSELFLPAAIFTVTDEELRMSEAQAIAAKDHPLVQISEEMALGPFERGREYRMTRWIAEKLRNEGILEIKDPQPISNTEVSKILWREVRSSVATKLPERFYPRLRSYLRILKNQVSKTGKPAAIKEEEQAGQNLRELINARLQKILRLTLAYTPPISALEGLSPEERELYEQVRESVESWIHELQDI